MRTAACFLVTVLLATVVASALTTTTGALVNDYPASLGHRLSRFIGKRGRFSVPVGVGKEVSSPSTATAIAGDSKFESTEEPRKKGFVNGRMFKICTNHGHCHKKKLVCPKKCSNKKPPGYLGTNHFGGHCIFNCKKCIAHC